MPANAKLLVDSLTAIATFDIVEAQTIFGDIIEFPDEDEEDFLESLQLTKNVDGELTFISKYIESGKIKYKETITKGFENAPQGLRDVLTGKNFGKQLIEI